VKKTMLALAPTTKTWHGQHFCMCLVKLPAWLERWTWQRRWQPGVRKHGQQWSHAPLQQVKDLGQFVPKKRGEKQGKVENVGEMTICSDPFWFCSQRITSFLCIQHIKPRNPLFSLNFGAKWVFWQKANSMATGQKTSILIIDLKLF
jgi:hypothetical protein